MIERIQLLGLLLTVPFVLESSAATTNGIYVTSTNDSGVGSLREAIQRANAIGGGKISLAVTGTIRLASSFAPLTNIDLLGPGAHSLSISGGRAISLFEVPLGSTCLLARLTIHSGLSTSGGAIFNSGTLVISDSVISNCTARSSPFGADASGGGIRNQGTLCVRRCSFTGNTASAIADFTFGYGRGGFGGAIASVNGFLEISHCDFSGNQATGDVGPTSLGGYSGGTAFGGAVAVSGGRVAITNSALSGNTASAGAGGSAGVGSGGPGGNAGGGAIYTDATVVSVVQCSLTHNMVSGGGGGSGRPAGGIGGGASGGAVSVNRGSAELSDCSLLDNTAQGGGGGSGTARDGLQASGYGGRGGDAQGGGLFVGSASLGLWATTVASNIAWSGGGGWGFAVGSTAGFGGAGGFAGGGGIAATSAQSAVLFNSTLSLNSLTAGAGGHGDTVSGLPGSTGGGGALFDNGSAIANSLTVVGNTAGQGGGVWNRNGSSMIQNCLFQGNVATNGPDASGIVSQGYNLFSNSSGLSNLLASDIQNTPAGTGPLQDNGGLTWTHALLANSPAIDRGQSGTNRLDQRGFPRSMDYPSIPNASNGDDIGACESDPVLRFISIERSEDGIVVSFSTRSDATYVLQSTSGFAASWEDSEQILGTGGVVRRPTGTEPPRQRFFRVIEQP